MNSLFNKDGILTEVTDNLRSGRPTSFNEENKSTFLKNLRIMGNLSQAARLSHLSVETIDKWLMRGKRTLEAVNNFDDDSMMDEYAWFNLDSYFAITEREMEMEGYILKAAQKSMRWEAAAFLIERKSSDNIYGMRQAVKVEGTVEHAFNIKIVGGDEWKSGGRVKIEGDEVVEQKLIEGVVDTEYKE